MTTTVETIDPDATIKDAAIKMRDLNIGTLPVARDNELIGILTDRDIVVRSIAKGIDPNFTTVSSAMSPNVEWCFDDQSVYEIVKRMEKIRARRLPVLNRDRKLVGIVSLGDIALRASRKKACELLEKVSQHEGAYP
jgi:CBS domain-containing protein